MNPEQPTHLFQRHMLFGTEMVDDKDKGIEWISRLEYTTSSSPELSWRFNLKNHC